MADIFISYSKSDHALALTLSTFLESEGWTVWWDKSLGAADLYRDEIMKQLVAARAVITIWTPNSIKSDWVRAEAGRAKADGKLIPAKTSELTYADIPLPFGEMHTENLASPDLIRAAIVAQLAKPAVTPSPFWQITGVFKYQVLTWIGIIGSAITLFANLSGVLDLADWARELVAHWHEWNQIFWVWIFSWIKIELPQQAVPVFSFLVFAFLMIAGINVQQSKQQSAGQLKPEELNQRETILGVGMLLNLAVFAVYYVVLGFMFMPDDTDWSLEDWMVSVDLALKFGLCGERICRWGPVVLIAMPMIVPMIYLLVVVKERLLVVCGSVLFLCVAGCLLVFPLNEMFIGIGGALSFIMFVFVPWLLQACWMMVILLSPLQQLVRRLAFVVFGVLTLVVLSEISKLNLHQYLKPAKVSEISSPAKADIS